MVFCPFMSLVSLTLRRVHVQISTQCCSALDFMLTFFFTQRQRGRDTPALHAMTMHVNSQPGRELIFAVAVFVLTRLVFTDLLPRLMQTLLSAVIFEDAQNQWSLSRPLLCLIVLDRQVR